MGDAASLDRITAVLQTSVLPHSVISHRTAAAFHGMPPPWWVDDGISFLAELDAGARYPAPIPSRRAGNEEHGDTGRPGDTAGTGGAGERSVGVRGNRLPSLRAPATVESRPDPEAPDGPSSPPHHRWSAA
ncbi:hypothetical protein GCM10009592_32800 [Brachybacterium rhamnosum]